MSAFYFSKCLPKAEEKTRGKKYMDDMPCKYTKQIG
jgi:hypothetical protein